MVINGIRIDKILLSHWLGHLKDENWSEESIHALLNPKDAQNVPRAETHPPCCASA